MMSYSVLKSPSMSTPSLLLGKSLMWPSEASTSKSFPRYLLMVFALAGDSTMTKDLGNAYSFGSSSFSKLTRMRTTLETLYKIFPGQLFDSPIQFQFKQHRKQFRRRNLRFELFY